MLRPTIYHKTPYCARFEKIFSKKIIFAFVHFFVQSTMKCLNVSLFHLIISP